MYRVVDQHLVVQVLHQFDHMELVDLLVHIEEFVVYQMVVFVVQLQVVHHQHLVHIVAQHRSQVIDL